jgi:superoxide reductase
MRRREAFKKIGLLGLVGLSGMALISCSNDEAKNEKEIPLEAKTIPESKSERELLISNRKRQTYAEPANPTKGELKHTPEISLGDKDEKGNTLVKITVGKDGIIHPATKEHWIDFIKVYVNERLVVDTEFANGGIRGFAYFYIALNKGDSLRAEAACNIHGIYESSINI